MNMDFYIFWPKDFKLINFRCTEKKHIIFALHSTASAPHLKHAGGSVCLVGGYHGGGAGEGWTREESRTGEAGGPAYRYDSQFTWGEVTRSFTKGGEKSQRNLYMWMASSNTEDVKIEIYTGTLQNICTCMYNRWQC